MNLQNSQNSLACSRLKFAHDYSMSRLVPISPKKMEKILFNLGFQRVRQKGSHVFYKHPDGRTTSVPFHSGEDLRPALINMILKEIELKRKDFEKLR